MAGEWIAIDLALPEKPEFQEIMELTGLDEPYVLWWLRKMWNWASMHCADGTARMTMARMVRVWGADETFWKAVASVGWLEIDDAASTVAVPGWDRRFSQAAKSRAQHADRSRAHESRRTSAGPPGAQAPEVTAHERGRGEEKREELPPLPREGFDQAAWQALRRAWNAGPGKAWKLVNPPANLPERLSDASWCEAYPQALARLASCRFFRTPVTLRQFCSVDDHGVTFVEKIVAGDFDDPPGRQRERGGDFGDHPAPPRVWDGEADKARRSMLAKLDRLKEEAS